MIDHVGGHSSRCIGQDRGGACVGIVIPGEISLGGAEITPGFII